MSDAFQTKTMIKTLLERAGVWAQRRLGQNFLIDRNLSDVLLRKARMDAQGVVLEVGTGMGMLTGALSRQARAVVSVEIDRTLAAIAREALACYKNVTLIEGNALSGKNLNDDVVAVLRERIEKGPGASLHLVANLPYQIASPLLIAVAESDLGFDRLAVTVQREVAQRITAAPSTHEYGLLSVLTQIHGTFKIERVLSPKVFWPAPTVESAFLIGSLDRALRSQVADYSGFKAFVVAAFQQRRKKLRNAIKRLAAPSPDAVAQAMTRLDISPDVRAQQLAPAQLAALFNEASGSSA